MAPREKGRVKSLRGVQHAHNRDEWIVKLPGQMRDWQIRAVCGGTRNTCNNGWMRELENKAHPVLKPLITGELPEKGMRISLADQTIIASWSVLKSMVSEFDPYGTVVTHHMQRKRMMNRQLPPEQGWGVWIGHFNRVNWKPEWISIPFLVLPHERTSGRSDEEVTYYNSSMTTQVIGKFFVHIIHSPMKNFINKWRFPVPHKGAVYRVWPLGSYSLKWPPAPLADGDADAISNALPSWLREVHLRTKPNR